MVLSKGEIRLSEQQQILADFGVEALSLDDLDKVLNQACILVAEGIDSEWAKIVENPRDSDQLFVRAETGFKLSESERWLERGTGSSAGHALMSGTPTVSGHADTDERFERADLIKRYGIRSVANVPIADTLGGPGVWWGVLEVDSREYDAFTENEIAFLRLYANLVSAAIGRRRALDDLQEALTENKRLLQELQHRIKNNLATVTSFINLQARSATNGETKDQLEAVSRRVETLRLVHERLHAQESTETVELRSYLEELTQNLMHFHNSDSEGISLSTQIDTVQFRTDMAIPVGLIINEFITNTLKYAFEDGNGRIDCDFHVDGVQALLTLQDDGIGLPEGFETAGGTGMSIINGLASQLGGIAEWESGAEQGTRLEVSFSIR